MISLTRAEHSQNPARLSRSSATPSGSADLFEQQLTEAVEGRRSGSGVGSRSELNVKAPEAQNSAGNRQIVVTVKNPSNVPASQSTPPATSPADPLAASAPTSALLAGLLPSNVQPAAPDSAAPSGPPPAPQPMTEEDAYWAMQPPAVQALRDMPYDQRMVAAQQLAHQGYAIDVPIMVWGWDPLKTMTLRQQDGYTWAPSMLQASIPQAPGLGAPGLASYDPKNPPAGSIQVSTAFAIGTSDGLPGPSVVSTSSNVPV